MGWSLATIWWIAAAVLVAVELATGSFYLLMLALGAAAAALASNLGFGLNAQLVIAAVVGVGAVAAWHFKRRGAPAGPVASENRDVNLDIGETVQITDWDAQGAAFAQYRGSRWSVRYIGAGLPQPGAFIIRRVEANRLLVDGANR
ncbi:MAG: NfeD family protein [Aquincola sp.]|nr:NfeD family protein [Aquincola sp.]